MTDPRIGTTLDGRYQIVGELAAGGMGVVYRGQRLGLGRGVAIKFLHAHMAADSSFLKRFALEAKAMARLQHPHCAAVIDFGVEGQEPYVVMDLVAGESLRSLLDRVRLPAWRALGIMRQVLSGLAHAHSHGITHRDIKPENIMVDASGSFGDQVRILDFGLAKLRENASGLTTGFVVGTPSYMAPEQTLAQPVDERTDIYACGVVLFEMLTGETPFHAEESVELLMMHQNTPPPRLAEKARDVRFSEQLEGAVLQAMAKDPAHRFASAAAFATALEEVPEAATRPSSALAAVTLDTPAPVLVGAPAPSAMGAVPLAQPAAQADTATPASQANATELLGSSQIEVVSSHVEAARAAAAESLAATRLRAFTAELAASQPAQPAAAVTAPQPVVAVTAPQPHAHATAPLAYAPDASPAVPGYGGVTPPPWAETMPRPGGQDGGSLAPATGPSGAPLDAARPASKRKLWIIGGAAAGVLALLVIVGLLPGNEPADTATEAAKDGTEDGIVFEEDEPVRPEYTGELAVAAASLEQGKNRRARDLLERLRRQDPDNPEIHYLLGKTYLNELWINDGLDAFRDAIALDPRYRRRADLIESAAAGLDSDSHHFAVARFLLRDIGAAARPALEHIATRHEREEVRERASRALSQLP